MQLTRNFQLNEFRSKCGRDFPAETLPRLKVLARNLQVLREELKLAISITSGYRSPEHNRKIGGASASRHMVGDAADIVVHGKTPQEVANTIERLIAEGKMQQGGLKAYDSFTHYDCRGVKARW